MRLVVHVRVNDALTGRPTPVRIRFGGPDGEYFPPLGRPDEFPVGRNEDVGGHVYLNGKRYAYIDGSCEVPLPAGVPLTVEITKGPTYVPVQETVTLGEGQLTLRFTIHRWTGDPWTDLVATDSRCHFLTPHSARLEAAAEGLDLINLLAVVQDFPSPDGHMYRVVPNLTAFSGQSPALEGVFVNTLNVHPALGRLALLNSHRAVYPLTFGHADETDDWSLADWCDQCHRKKGLVVWCDAYRPETGLPGGEALVNAILGKVDAIEIDAHHRTAALLPHWYRLLDAGVRLPIVGGSGKDSNRLATGGMRTLTPPGANRSYGDWVGAVRAGRSAASNGPLLRLEVNESLPATGIRLRAEASSNCPFERLELVANGTPIASARPTGDTVLSANVEAEHELPAGGWIAARCLGSVKPNLYPHVPVFAHTSAVFVDVAGREPPGRREATSVLVRQVEAVRHWVDTIGHFTVPRRREHLQSLCDAALARLRGAG